MDQTGASSVSRRSRSSAAARTRARGPELCRGTRAPNQMAARRKIRTPCVAHLHLRVSQAARRSLPLVMLPTHHTSTKYLTADSRPITTAGHIINTASANHLLTFAEKRDSIHVKHFLLKRSSPRVEPMRVPSMTIVASGSSTFVGMVLGGKLFNSPCDLRVSQTSEGMYISIGVGSMSTMLEPSSLKRSCIFASLSSYSTQTISGVPDLNAVK